MRSSLHPKVWELLQATCARLTSAPEIVWAGIAETKLNPTWLAFSGPDEQTPLPPEPDQGFRELEDLPLDMNIAVLVPERPRRSYVCGLLPQLGLTVVVVPGCDPGATDRAIAQLRGALDDLLSVAPKEPAGPGFRLRRPHQFAPLHESDWLSIPRGRGGS